VDDSSYPNSRRRIAYFLDKLHIVPSTILALTFSKKATEELQARIGQLIPHARGGVTVKTYHAFCLGFIRENWAKLVSDCLLMNLLLTSIRQKWPRVAGQMIRR
jgi:superfamily I DNA/RNA helicase